MTDEGGVLGNLPNSRPGKRSAKRDGQPRASAKAARGSKPRPQREQTTAVKGAGIGDRVDVDRDIRGQRRHDPASAQEMPGDPLSAAVRSAAGLAVTGVKVAGAVTQELLRRLPRP
jgi:hypothetical protein